MEQATADRPVDEAEFERLADAELHRLLEAIIATGEDVDADLESGVLTIAYPDGAKHVINSHRAARQIWMAAERRAWHFDYARDRGGWIAAQSGRELWSVVGEVLGRRLGSEVALL
jgi:CyaY protein